MFLPLLVSFVPMSFATTPVISLNKSSGPVGTVIFVTGSGLVPSTQYSVCFTSVITPPVTCPAVLDSSNKLIVTNASGDLPAGTTITVPTGASGLNLVSANYYGCPDANLVPCASAPFTVTSTTTSVSTSTTRITGVPEFGPSLALPILIAVLAPLAILAGRRWASKNPTTRV